MTISVSGGADSIAAHYEDLQAVATSFDAAADEVQAVADRLGALAFGARVGVFDLLTGLRVQGALDVLVAPFGALHWSVDELRGSAAGLRLAAASYLAEDTGLGHEIGSLLDGAARLGGASATGLSTLVRTRSPGAAGQAFLTADPALAGEASSMLLFTGLEQTAGRHYPDGHPVVEPLGPDPLVEAPPRDLPDLMDALAVRDETASGEISVSFLTGPDGTRRAVVDIPGTKSWSPMHTSDVTSLSTNARALVGVSTSYERGVLDAMDRAGVRTTDQVMLVGHSEGGMVAVNAARDAVRTGRFDVTHVVTAGSPIGRTVGGLPESVRVLALENTADVVPQLDARDNPVRPNVTTVHFDRNSGRVQSNHSLLDSYIPGAADCDASDDPSVRAFTRSASGFFDDTAERTHDFLILRDY
jgi:pimeloyl-ACP methyl ester carboxylesterase